MVIGRVVHCQRADYDVYIGRATPRYGLPASKWANPFKVKPYGPYERDEAIRLYEQRLLSRPELVAALPELRGKVLGCWCAPEACHGDVLVRLANGDAAVTAMNTLRGSKR